jgi:hypothetical protein
MESEQRGHELVVRQKRGRENVSPRLKSLLSRRVPLQNFAVGIFALAVSIPGMNSKNALTGMKIKRVIIFERETDTSSVLVFARI